MTEIYFERVWVGAGAATALQTLGMGEVLCQDCVDMIFRTVWQVCDHLGLRFRQQRCLRSAVLPLESASKSPVGAAMQFDGKGDTKSSRQPPRRWGLMNCYARSVPT